MTIRLHLKIDVELTEDQQRDYNQGRLTMTGIAYPLEQFLREMGFKASWHEGHISEGSAR